MNNIAFGFWLLKNLETKGWLLGSLLKTVTTGILDSSINFSRASTLNSLESTKSSSNGLNNLTTGPLTEDSPRGRFLASKV
uniref:Uncharacterized protein n=1 Tax=Lotus japonicus TaxID=34305 RepID=I3SDV3_LOTJA|nr:unknown [Lotus japonicus]